jgi:hypothetical protein
LKLNLTSTHHKYALHQDVICFQTQYHKAHMSNFQIILHRNMVVPLTLSFLCRPNFLNKNRAMSLTSASIFNLECKFG